jgi:hypothetical protein
MVIALALLAAAAFGAGDQYLGSGHIWGIGWPTDVSLLSAPWLVLAFVAGSTQRDPRRAALLGLGSVFTGPLFGWFGQQWRTRRAIAGALVTAAALCLEPLARRASVDPIRFRAVWLAEVAAGLALAAAVLLRRSSSGAGA